MIGRLLFLFILVPLLELYILIKIGGYLGAFPTVALVVFTALLGLVLARFEGLRTLQQIRQSLSQGIVPAEEMVDGVLIFIGGILLIIPGVLTDLFALVLLIPYTRTIFQALAAAPIRPHDCVGECPTPLLRQKLKGIFLSQASSIGFTSRRASRSQISIVRSKCPVPPYCWVNEREEAAELSAIYIQSAAITSQAPLCPSSHNLVGNSYTFGLPFSSKFRRRPPNDTRSLALFYKGLSVVMYRK